MLNFVQAWLFWLLSNLFWPDHLHSFSHHLRCKIYLTLCLLFFFPQYIYTHKYIFEAVFLSFVFQQGVWETLLAALEILIRANHHQQMFNIKQLLKAQVVHHFLLTCQVLQVLPLWNPTLCLANTRVCLGRVG